MSLRIVFMGTPDFAVPALEALHDSDHEIIAVYTQPPKPKGRGYEVQMSPVQAFAEKNKIPVFHPKSLKDAAEQKNFADLKADVAVVAAYGLILPKDILNAPKHGCINIHASLLPRWRGASPIQQSILKGDKETGVTLMQMDEGLDTGPMIVKRALPIESHTTSQSLHDDLSVLGAGMIVQVIDRLASEGKLESEPQDNAKATYAPLLKKEDGKINWSQSAEDIDRQIRALNPWPGVSVNFKDKRIKILEVKNPSPDLADARSPSPLREREARAKPERGEGQILDRNGNVACGKNTILKLTILQPEGKNPMDFASALNGGYVTLGEKFS